MDEARAHEIIEKLNRHQSIVAKCHDGTWRWYDARSPSLAERGALLKCLRIRELANVDFDAAFDYWYSLKEQTPDVYKCNAPDNAMRRRSMSLYGKLKSVSQLPLFWRLFYTGEVCLPSYQDDFVGAGDNRLASKSVAKKFFEVTQQTGLLVFDSQNGSQQDGQKAYVLAISPNIDLMHFLADQVNRISGMFAYFVDLTEWATLLSVPQQEALESRITVTYDAPAATSSSLFLAGNPFTSLPTASPEFLYFLKEGASPALQTDIDRTTWYQLTMCDTIFTRDILLDTLHGLAQQWAARSRS